MLALALAACELKDTPEPSIRMTERNRFTPSSLTVGRGTTVYWKNFDHVSHTTTSEPALAENRTNAIVPEGAAPWNSGRIYAGEIWSHTFDTPGTYVFFCQQHEGHGMVGSITVIDL